MKILFLLFILRISSFTTTYYEDTLCQKPKFFEVKNVAEKCFNYQGKWTIKNVNIQETNNEKYYCNSKTITHDSYLGDDKECAREGFNTTFGLIF
jgi:hypothetical protein